MPRPPDGTADRPSYGVVIEIRPRSRRIASDEGDLPMTPTAFDTSITYRIAMDRQAALREEVAQARAVQTETRSGQPLPPTRGPLAALRRRLAGSASFA